MLAEANPGDVRDQTLPGGIPAEHFDAFASLVNNSGLHPDKINQKSIIYVRWNEELPEMVGYRGEPVAITNPNQMVTVYGSHGSGPRLDVQAVHLLTQEQFVDLQKEFKANIGLESEA